MLNATSESVVLTRNKEIDKLQKETTAKAWRRLRKEGPPDFSRCHNFFWGEGVVNLLTQSTNQVPYDTQKPLDSQKSSGLNIRTTQL